MGSKLASQPLITAPFSKVFFHKSPSSEKAVRQAPAVWKSLSKWDQAANADGVRGGAAPA